MGSVGILHHFGNMEDPRVDRHKLHAPPDIFLSMFFGVICGAESCRDFVDLAESKIDYLERLMPLNNGNTSDSFKGKIGSSHGQILRK
ncbi:transposase family protein [Microbulbifer okhotskensis]|uniref:transposase family protein n=1 Tax=Microbulbifer okhotskensis TaxID=2926617 RepID=UPI00359C5952